MMHSIDQNSQLISVSNKWCNFLLFINQIIKNSIMAFTKILSSTIVFNIDNNRKCLLSTKSAYKNDFSIIM